MADRLILRPNWPHMYPNLTLCQLERTPTELQDVYGYSMLLCGILVVVIISQLKQHTSSVTLPLALLCCLIGIALSPFTLLTLLLFNIYRLLVRATLSMTCPNYRGLMDGADAYWSLETDGSRPIINILALVELSSDSHRDLRYSLKKIFEDRLLSENQLLKLKCLRKLSRLGYFYWEELNAISLDEHIRWMDLNVVTEETVTEYVSHNCNNPLPYNNLSLWEVLISRKFLTRDDRELYPVLFRIHHAVGDGIALVNLFLNSFTDNGCFHKVELAQGKKRSAEKQDLDPTKELFLTPCSRSRRRSSILLNDELKKLNKHCMYRITTTLQKISVVFFAPYVLLSQACLGVDDNLLHGNELVGKKHVGWAFSHNTFAKVKFIKDKLKYHFTDVLLFAVSNALEDYYLLHGEPPKDLTLVIPARLPSEDKMNETNIPGNRFTVGMIKLPIVEPNKLEAIRRSADGLRARPDYLVNYWLLKIACTYYPIALLKDHMKSKQATIAMSNIPGPDYITKIDGNTIHDLVFWLPNRDTTGVGVSILSYAGKLNFGLIVDAALIPKREDVQSIVRRMVDEIDSMYCSIKDNS